MRARGADELRAVADACRQEANGRRVVRDMAAEIRTSGEPIKEEIRAHILGTLPQSGGLAAWVAASRVGINVRTTGNNVGLRVKVGRNSQGGRSDLKSLDAGRVRHPLYGNRGNWYGQGVTPGSISEAITEEGRDQLEEAVLTAAERAAQRIARG